MGVVGNIFGLGKPRAIGEAVGRVAEVFVANKTDAQRLHHLDRQAAVEQFGIEFTQDTRTAFDSVINGLNRLPRPIMALGAVGLFVFAMADPEGFGIRMQGLETVPDPLWWLLGAVVSFYFGARELHYFRQARPRSAPVRANTKPIKKPAAAAFSSSLDSEVSATDPNFNAAIEEWRNTVTS